MNDEAARQGRPANSTDTDNGTARRGHSAPAVLVVFELESAPRVIASWNTDEDDERMTLWFDARPDYAELLHRAVELSGEAA